VSRLFQLMAPSGAIFPVKSVGLLPPYSIISYTSVIDIDNTFD